ncbi:hypothetical protein EVAR_49461_1 [Eumeta japonica]|uniref:Uncharacterized protein n=1 Tax=Eumeta variegata TaxID=151549 RepID=A0A4C1Y0U8_EUMVA|nr:hypothetical protein EVAR_49461_1 [Eumeta japonica]
MFVAVQYGVKVNLKINTPYRRSRTKRRGRIVDRQMRALPAIGRAPTRAIAASDACLSCRHWIQHPLGTVTKLKSRTATATFTLRFEEVQSEYGPPARPHSNHISLTEPTVYLMNLTDSYFKISSRPAYCVIISTVTSSGGVAQMVERSLSMREDNSRPPPRPGPHVAGPSPAAGAREVVADGHDAITSSVDVTEIISNELNELLSPIDHCHGSQSSSTIIPFMDRFLDLAGVAPGDSAGRVSSRPSVLISALWRPLLGRGRHEAPRYLTRARIISDHVGQTLFRAVRAFIVRSAGPRPALAGDTSRPERF